MNRRVKNFIMPILCASLILCAVITVDQISRASDKAEEIQFKDEQLVQDLAPAGAAFTLFAVWRAEKVA